MTAVDVVPLVDEGLGNSAYLVDLGDGRALAVDVSLDLRPPDREASRRGLRVAFAADTHLHADFLSGARQLSATEDARVLASAAGHREFTHTGMHDGDEVPLGGLRLRALGTPGHTHEHLSFLLLDGDRPVGVFTGGSLIVGAAARTDLVAPERTEELARKQFSSLRRLADLPDDVAVWPTHGAGSFCSAPPGAERTSTIGREKATNPLLRLTDEDEFVDRLLGSLGSYPPYFARLGEINRLGPPIMAAPPVLPELDADAVRALLDDGALIVDVRPVREFAAAHAPGALSNPARPAFASWLGWLAPDDRPLVIMRGPDQDPTETAWQAAKIGYTNLAGECAFDAWTAARLPTTGTKLVSADEVSGTVLDVRQTAEFTGGHLPGALHLELGDLAGRVDEVPAGPTVVMCGHGERAMSGASLLERAGHREVAVLIGGADDWVRATGGRLDSGT
ncbi:Glyoxylase, beta-lactamase superfamily II [Actinokineospora alba]|uniref:Glyoxylase, beta-lactamase superfamily II n=1 Tax=Actinokineospora alba TaxID=504798 RepID=A0A1H0NB98_9PSEU|nr:MBL fold metallo-hydrolase [Actinokineospora alba]TDP68655.1 glyoxylase-like metal-dependent hydrolase (beta-lactamase superfamily II) [Actinokineospora alba]SDH83731.1 Glyoxylase, beta-lactamase superfamily II [Actinokineospora alba]SDO89931.1 Glyoxylase, beta-lactamase superfamily II [Actinokineospora alba]